MICRSEYEFLMAQYVFVLVMALGATVFCESISGWPPSFTQEPEDTFVFETDDSGQPTTLTIDCGTDGEPAPTVTWFRSGVEVDSTLMLDNGSLSIPDITEGESASRDGIPYYCTATNTLGTIRSKTVQVFYAYFDGIHSPASPTSVNVTVGQDVALLCDVSGASPPPVIEWLDDSGVITENFDSNRARYLDGGRYLLLRALTVEQSSRTYHCRITNAFIHNSIESAGSYTLNNLGTSFPDDMLVVYKELENEITAVVGETVEFSFVSATLANPFITQYQIDSRTSDIGTTGPLGTVENVQLPVTGTDTSYDITLLVTVMFGTENANMMFASTLTVIEPAFISDVSPNKLDQFVGDPLSFFCTVAGAPAPDVVWYFNGEILTPSGGLTINGGTIDIPSPTTAHSGMYQCFVSNTANTVHASIALQVREPEPPVVTRLSTGQDRCRNETAYSMTEGEPLTLSVAVLANPCPEVEWRLDGRTLELSDTYITSSCNDSTTSQLGDGSYNFSITISSVSESTLGHYNATFTNRAGIATSQSAFVTPEVPVRVLGVQIQDSTCLRDNVNETIVCAVEGYPYPGITFEKDNNPLMPVAGRVTVNDCMMVLLTPVVISDEGLYSCTAKNVANGATIISNSDPTMLQYCTPVQVVSLMPSNSNPHQGEAISLTCIVSGVPTPSIAWTKNNVTLTNTNRIAIATTGHESRLQIAGVLPEDNGVYVCVATSITGEARDQTSIEVSESEGSTATTDEPGTGATTNTTTGDSLVLPIAAAGGVGSLVLGIAITTTAVIVCLRLRMRTKAKLASGSENNHIYDEIPYDNIASYVRLRKNPAYADITTLPPRAQHVTHTHTVDQPPDLTSADSAAADPRQLTMANGENSEASHEQGQNEHAGAPLDTLLDTSMPIQTLEENPATDICHQSDEANLTESGTASDQHENNEDSACEQDPTGSMPYDKCLETYEQCGDKYERLQSYEQASDQYDQIQNYERTGRVYEEVQHYEKPCDGYDHIQHYELTTRRNPANQ